MNKYERVGKKLLELNEENKELRKSDKESKVILPKARLMWKMVV